jgi:murein lipoprotein
VLKANRDDLGNARISSFITEYGQNRELTAMPMFFVVIILNKEKNMNKVIKLSMIALALSLVTACATTSDIENLQSQVNGLDTSVKQASSDAASAQATAADAAAKAAAAEAAANRAAELSEDANNKLDKRFKKSMMK